MQMRLIKLLLLSIVSLGSAATRADGLIIDNAGRAFRLHESFVTDLKQALPENLGSILARPALRPD